MINPDLDFDHWRQVFARHERAQIPLILDEASAARLHACLHREVPWTLAYREEGDSRVLDYQPYQALGEKEKIQRLEQLQNEARGQYGFAYDSYMMVDAYREQRDPALLLNVILEFLNSVDFLTFARGLTGLPEIRRVSAQATRYLPGHFLKRHNDLDAERNRLVAYVFNLTRDWHADWGGLLHFLDDCDNVIDTFIPHYNSLSLLRVPQMHMVSLVAPWAEAERLSITGWFMR